MQCVEEYSDLKLSVLKRNDDFEPSEFIPNGKHRSSISERDIVFTVGDIQKRVFDKLRAVVTMPSGKKDSAIIKVLLLNFCNFGISRQCMIVIFIIQILLLW